MKIRIALLLTVLFLVISGAASVYSSQFGQILTRDEVKNMTDDQLRTIEPAYSGGGIVDATPKETTAYEALCDNPNALGPCTKPGDHKIAAGMFKAGIEPKWRWNEQASYFELDNKPRNSE